MRRGLSLPAADATPSESRAWAEKVLAGAHTPDEVRAAAAWFDGAESDPVYLGARRETDGPQYAEWLLRGGNAGRRWAARLSTLLDAAASMGVAWASPDTPIEAPTEAPDPHTAVMLPIRPEEAAMLAQPGGTPAEELHITLAYLGRRGDCNPADLTALGDALGRLAADTAPIVARVTGIARFEGVEGGQDAIVALVSSPALDALRAAVVAECEARNLPLRSVHGFTPHITLAYVAPMAEHGVQRAPLTAVTLDEIALWSGTSRGSSRLQGFDRAPITTDPETVMPDPAPVTPDASTQLRGAVVPFDTGEGDPVDNVDWNRQHVIGRLRAWASSDGTGDYDALDPETLSRAFAWYDPASAAAKNLSAYRLPHHDVVNGKLVLTRQGLLAACRTLMGGDHGIPEADEDGVKMHLARHCAQLNLPVPWEAQLTGATELDPATMSAVGADGVALPDGVVSISWIQVAKVGTYRGHSAGEFTFSSAVFARIVANFLATANRRVPIDYEHATEILSTSVLQNGAPAVGWIVELDNRGDAGLFARVEWIDATAVGYIRAKKYRFFSPAVVFAAVNPVTGEPQGPTLVSGALTNRPFLDGMEPVTARDLAAEAVTVAAAPERAQDVPAEPSPVVTASAGGDTPVSVTTETDTPPAAPEPAAAPVVVPASAAAEAPALTLRDALAAVTGHAASPGLRTLSWYGNDIDDLDDLAGLLRYVMGLSSLATADDVKAALGRLAMYVADPAKAELDCVDAGRIIRHLRGELRMPDITPAMEVLSAVLGRFTEMAAAEAAEASLSVGPADVHVPGASTEPATATPMSAAAPVVSPEAAPITLSTDTETPPMNPQILSALALPADATDDAVLAAITALSQRVDAVTRLSATERVDALISAGQIDANAREFAITTAMRDADGFTRMFPKTIALSASAAEARPETPAAPAAAPVSRETASELATPITTTLRAETPAPGAPAAAEPPPAPGSAGYSDRLYAESQKAVDLAAGRGETITLRSAMEATELRWARLRAAV